MEFRELIGMCKPGIVTNHWGWSPRGVMRWVRWGWAKPIQVWGIVSAPKRMHGPRIRWTRCKVGPLCFGLGYRTQWYHVTPGGSGFYATGKPRVVARRAA